MNKFPFVASSLAFLISVYSLYSLKYSHIESSSIVQESQSRITPIADKSIFDINNKMTEDAEKKEVTTKNIDENATEMVTKKLKTKLTSIFSLTSPDQQILVKPVDSLFYVHIKLETKPVAFFTDKDANYLIPIRSLLKLDTGLLLLQKSLNSQSNEASSVSADKPEQDITPAPKNDLTNQPEVSTEEAQKIYKQIASLTIDYPGAEPKVGEFIVFFDPDCDYCKNFYAKIPKLQEAGFTVKLALSPLSGLKSALHKQYHFAYCDSNPQSKIDALVKKQPIFVQDDSCADPMPEINQAAKKLRTEGTPYMFLPDGKVGRISILRDFINERSKEAISRLKTQSQSTTTKVVQ